MPGQDRFCQDLALHFREDFPHRQLPLAHRSRAPLRASGNLLRRVRLNTFSRDPPASRPIMPALQVPPVPPELRWQASLPRAPSCRQTLLSSVEFVLLLRQPQLRQVHLRRVRRCLRARLLRPFPDSPSTAGPFVQGSLWSLAVPTIGAAVCRNVPVCLRSVPAARVPCTPCRALA